MLQSLQPNTTRRVLVSALFLTLCATALLLAKGALFGAASAAKPAAVGPVLLVPVPEVDLAVPGKEFPSMGLIGEKFCYTARIENTGANPLTDVGYNPYLQLILPPDITIDNPNTDVSLPGVCTGPSCDESSSYPIALPSPFTCPGQAGIDPPCSVNDQYGVPVSVPAGHTLWLIQPPIGSLFPGEPGIDVKICLKMSDTAPVIPATLLTVIHKPIFQYGPNFGPPVPGVTQFNDVMPVVVKLTKNALNYTSNKTAPAPTVEIPAGSCHPITFELVANIADSKSLTGIEIRDALPPGMTLLSGTVTVTGVSSFNNCSSTNIVCVNNMSDQGAPGTPPDEFEKRDIVVQFQAYANTSLLNPTTCAAATRLNTATVDAFYEGNALPQQSAPLLIEVEHVTFQKTAAGPNVNDPLRVMPGDIVTNTLNFQVSESIGVSNVIVTDTVPNGMSLPVNGIGALTCNGVGQGLVTPVISNAGGSKILTYNFGSRPACSKCNLAYTSKVEELYVAPLAGQPVLASDSLIPSCGSPSNPLNCTKITYNIVGGATACSDDTAAGVIVKPTNIEKSLVTPQPPEGFQPGDAVTFKLKFCIPSGDTKNIVLTDFLPSPVFDATQISGVMLTQTGFTGASLVTTKNAADNSVKFEIKNTSNPDVISTVGAGTVCFEIKFTAPVTTNPYADDLNHANLVQSKNTKTDGTLETHLTGLVLRFRAPKLKITKGVFSVDNPNAVVSPTPSPNQPNPPVNGNVTGVDANDTITFYLTVKNEGGAPAHGVKITDLLPTGLLLKHPPLVMPVGTTPTPSSASCPGGCPSPTTPIPAGKTVVIDFGASILLPGDSWVLKLQLMIPPMGLFCQSFTNTASVIWSSSSAFDVVPPVISPPFSAVSDTATIATAGPTITKTVLATNQAHTTGNNVVIGEIVDYEVKVRIPEGKFNGVTLMDTMSGLASSLTVGTVTTSSTNVCINNSCSSLPSFVFPTLSGTKFTPLSAATLENRGIGNTNEFLIFRYSGVVLNIPTNVMGGTALQNTVSFVSEECNVSAQGPPLTVVEPKLQISKAAFNPTTGLPITNADAGDTIEWRITLHRSAR